MQAIATTTAASSDWRLLYNKLGLQRSRIFFFFVSVVDVVLPNFFHPLYKQAFFDDHCYEGPTNKVTHLEYSSRINLAPVESIVGPTAKHHCGFQFVQNN